jgi:hypothetical protein
MKKFLQLTLLSITVLIYSCKKDDANADTASIQGTYKLTYLTAKTNSTITDDDGGKAVSNADYTTIDNHGTIVFDASKLTTTGISYSVNSVSSNYFYQDDELIDSISFPLVVTIPPISSAGTYKLIGADSIYISAGLVPAAGSGGAITEGSGGRYKLDGKVLTITQHFLKDSVFTESGISYHQRESAVSSIVMEKQ